MTTKEEESDPEATEADFGAVLTNNDS